MSLTDDSQFLTDSELNPTLDPELESVSRSVRVEHINRTGIEKVRVLSQSMLQERVDQLVEERLQEIAQNSNPLPLEIDELRDQLKKRWEETESHRMEGFSSFEKRLYDLKEMFEGIQSSLTHLQLGVNTPTETTAFDLKGESPLQEFINILKGNDSTVDYPTFETTLSAPAPKKVPEIKPDVKAIFERALPESLPSEEVVIEEKPSRAVEVNAYLGNLPLSPASQIDTPALEESKHSSTTTTDLNALPLANDGILRSFEQAFGIKVPEEVKPESCHRSTSSASAEKKAQSADQQRMIYSFHTPDRSVQSGANTNGGQAHNGLAHGAQPNLHKLAPSSNHQLDNPIQVIGCGESAQRKSNG